MRRGNAFLIGLFVLVGIGLVVAGVLAGTGGRLFARKERAGMYFSNSVYGLQVGSPVMFRGVRMGSVTGIGLLHDEGKDDFTIPVVVELEREGITTVRADGSRDRHALRLSQMVDRGLTAQLSMQSLLTGQLYVDLDMRPGKPAARRGGARRLPEIPTSVTTIQNLKAQLEDLDVRSVVNDISAMARSARELVSAPELKTTVKDAQQTMASLRQLSDRLNRRADPLAQAAQQTLSDARQALGKLGGAADGVHDTARRIGSTSDRVGALVAPDSQLLQSLQRAADDLAQTAGNLRAVTGSDAPLVEGLERTLADVGRASRAVRELADLLERHPDALLRGRPTTETTP